MEVGKIFSYDQTKGAGIAILNDGSQVEFSLSNWKNIDTLPKVGQIISWIDEMIDVITEDEKKKILSDIESKRFAKKLKLDEKLANKVEEITTIFTNGGAGLIKPLSSYYSNIGYLITGTKDDENSFYLFMEKYLDNGVEKIRYVKDGEGFNLSSIDNQGKKTILDLDEIKNEVIKNLDSSLTTVDIGSNIQKNNTQSKNSQNKEKQKVQDGVDAVGITSLIVGILGFFFLGIILGPIALMIGLSAPKPRSGFAVAGIVIGSILSIITIGALLFGLGMVGILATGS